MQTLITSVDRFRINDSIEWLSTEARRGPLLGRLMRRMREASSVAPADIPATYVTMNSHVRLRYQATNEIRDLRLVYPNSQTAPADGVDSVSVISPVGAALLGSKVGDVIEWIAPAGPQKGDVIAVLYQPEANGDPD
ncbi:GreA/GreB family elongation factor [Candidatus Sumerlaeota bacterium]|nr:GreA/GreB family elongation factor [Candidatus Sumerlaeota bacterium]HNM45469.1 GreA/GreB family elongation factor [Candidatus Sumerlaeota bacterium]